MTIGLLGFQVGEIGYPDFVWKWLIKFMLQMIDTIPRMVILDDFWWFGRLSCTHLREIHGFH